MKKYSIVRYMTLVVVLFVVSCSGKSEVNFTVGKINFVYDEARVQYDKKNYTIAEGLYLKALKQKDLPFQHRVESLLQLASITAERIEYLKTLEYTNTAYSLQPSLVANGRWFNLWERAVIYLGNEEASNSIDYVLSRLKAGTMVRAKISLLQAYSLWMQGRIVEAIGVLDSIEAIPFSKVEKGTIEQVLLNYLNRTPQGTFDLLLSTVVGANKTVFPYSLFYLEEAVRFSKAGKKEQARERLAFLKSANAINNTALVKKFLNLPPIVSNKKIDIVFLLPLSSGYKKFSWQIVNGATVAQEALSRIDKNLKIHFINTETKNWLDKLEKFPRGTLIGGPLQQSVFNMLSKSGFLSKYVVFTFLHSLPAGVEGTSAWRFYNSPEDQINALLRFTASLGVKSYGVLYPQDAYGTRMTSLFREKSKSFGGKIIKLQKYTNQPATWPSITASFLSTEMIDGNPVPNADFTATFLPDSFVNATVLISSFFYNGEQRQIIMGTSLWEDRGKNTTYASSNFTLVIYPSAWNPDSRRKLVETFEARLLAKSFPAANRWSALGYDFVRYAYALGKSQARQPADINAFLSKPNRIEWTFAPITWSTSGIASQQLFILSPVETSGRIMFPSLFTKRLEKAYESHNARLEVIFKDNQGNKIGD